MELKDQIEFFEKNVSSITDIDYGDFMRKSNTYFNRLLGGFQKPNEEQRKVLYSLKELIQFSPERDIDLTTEKILEVCNQLKRIV